MADKERLESYVISGDTDSDMSSSEKKRLEWYYAPAFLLFWLVLLVAIVLPVFFNLPIGLRIEDEHTKPGEFVAERAERILFDFEMIGPKVVGSFANENLTVQLLYDEIELIRRSMHHDLYELEVDVQVVSGAYMHWTMINMYQGLQNFVVKLSSKNSTSQNYLLINSHFDSKPGSPGSGDDGAMVVVMLEVLRVLATSREPFSHPIVFLFNGAEENPLQASHGFITQHKWAQNCRALINLDSAGSGHKEILFQSGPNHPWLMKYYSKYAKRPYATSIAEELFQANIIPSDTDFRIFRDYGHVPGLDFAHSYNGYVYHTKFDKFDVIPRGTLQSTGDNILSLARAFANAPEMEEPDKYAEGHSIFYDFMGLFFIYYTETQGQIINCCVSVIVVVLIGISFWRMAATSYLSIGSTMKTFVLIEVLHILGIVLALGLPLLMAVMFDAGDRSMTWFSQKWLVFGLYVCPSLIGLCLPTLLYLSFNKNDKLRKSFKIQMILHAHALFLALICIVLTFVGLRSSYVFMISLLFYGIALILNFLTTLHNRGKLWSIIVILSQVLPFLYMAYIFFALCSTLMPMMGRFGTNLNPDLLVGGLCALGTILAMGFVSPMVNMFRHSKTVLLALLATTFIFSMMAISPIGFPYTAKTNVGRVNFLNVQRVFYEYDGSVSKNESGYYFDFQDRRIHYPIQEHIDMSNMESVAEDCDEMMMCGLPLFNHRWFKSRMKGIWLPSDDPVEIPETPTLTLVNKTVNPVTNLVRYNFKLRGPPHMSIYLLPIGGVTVVDWSFLKTMLQEKETYKPPYHIYFSYGKDSAPLDFYFDLKIGDSNVNKPLFELGISGHYVNFDFPRSKHTQTFIKSFPDYIFVMEWPSSYERYLF
ncbi:endoplasmic reticulum metallopeptidase 1 isoform X1 [Musca domestica]|uniref:FXNA-like protease n=2 Tax=Musca domestica TaxID=7370 RepID=A0A1I8MAT5_MUSDO|nr:endoplasmic reticulum metallopeptidase 1 isoform X1 [Musca domestica]